MGEGFTFHGPYRINFLCLLFTVIYDLLVRGGNLDPSWSMLDRAAYHLEKSDFKVRVRINLNCVYLIVCYYHRIIFIDSKVRVGFIRSVEEGEVRVECFGSRYQAQPAARGEGSGVRGGRGWA